jgi:outer membrane beta-barrel protein
MKNRFVGLLIGATICTYPATVLAQGDELVLDEESTDVEVTETDGAEPEDETGGGLDDICAIDPDACPNQDLGEIAKRQLDEQIYAVQQIYALRARRFELSPFWSFTLNDPFIAHPGPGLALNYYISNVMGVGANFQWYTNNESSFNAEQSSATRVGALLTEYRWSAAGNFTYVPAYGKFAGFGDFIFHYDMYVVGGVGAISARPKTIVDPGNRNFPFKVKVAFNAGIGIRIFFTRWLAANLEVRDYIFNDQLESLTKDPDDPLNQATWYGDSRLTNNVQAQVGISIFLPFSVEYKLPK